MSVRSLATLSAMLFLAAAGITEAEDRWRHRGPVTESATVLIDPVVSAVLYAQSYHNLFRSLDAGASWHLMTAGLPPAGVEVVVLVSPEGSGTLYAWNKNGSNTFFKSIDGGSNWSEVQHDLGSGVLVVSMAVPTTMPATRYLGSALSCQQFLGCSGGGVYKSTNGGTGWRSSGLSGQAVSGLFLSPTVPNLIYGNGAMAFFRSTDGGGRWTVMAPPSESGGFSRSPVALDPARPLTIYHGQNRGVFKSTTGGESWSHLTDGLPRNRSEIYYGASAIVVDPSNSNTVYAGFAVGGNVVSPGVFRSHDGGLTWSAVNAGLTDTYVNSLAIDPTGEHLYAGTDSGIFELDTSTRAVVRLPPPGRLPRVVGPRQ